MLFRNARDLSGAGALSTRGGPSSAGKAAEAAREQGQREPGYEARTDRHLKVSRTSNRHTQKPIRLRRTKNSIYNVVSKDQRSIKDCLHTAQI